MLPLRNPTHQLGWLTLLQLTDADEGHQFASCATTCCPSGFTIYTAPENGALFVSCCGIASGLAIGSATHNVNVATTRLHGAKDIIALVVAEAGGERCRVQERLATKNNRELENMLLVCNEKAQPQKDERSKSTVVGRIPGCYPALKTDRITLEASLES